MTRTGSQSTADVAAAARRRPARLLGAVALLAATAVAGTAAAAPRSVLGKNLVPNPSFEESALEPAPVPAGSLPQPVLPTGWTAEGLTLLFDHSPNVWRTGKRGAAISGALGPGAQVCDASSGSYQCVPNPLHGPLSPVDDEAMRRWSVRPFWVTQAALPVAPGKTYRFSTWAIRPSLDPNAGVDGEGAATWVRWLGADGSTVAVAPGPVHVKTARRDLGWRLVSADVVAPAGAVGARLLLGHTDWTTTSAQVAFDDVSFQEVVRR